MNPILYSFESINVLYVPSLLLRPQLKLLYNTGSSARCSVMTRGEGWGWLGGRSERDGSSGPDLIWFRGNAIMFLFLLSCELGDWILCLLHRDLLGFTVILCTDQICPIDWLILQNEGQYVLRQLLNTWLLFGEECGLSGVTDLG